MLHLTPLESKKNHREIYFYFMSKASIIREYLEKLIFGTIFI
jgi:hypothetical protein